MGKQRTATKVESTKGDSWQVVVTLQLGFASLIQGFSTLGFEGLDRVRSTPASSCSRLRQFCEMAFWSA